MTTTGLIALVGIFVILAGVLIALVISNRPIYEDPAAQVRRRVNEAERQIHTVTQNTVKDILDRTRERR